MFGFKPILLIIAINFFVSSLSAQETFIKNELELAYGVGTAPELKGVTGNFFIPYNSNTTIDDILGIGGFSIAYNRYISKRLCVGVTGVYTKTTVTYHVPVAKFDWAVFTMLANVKYNYVFDPLFHLYSGISIGGAFNNVIGATKGSNQAFAYQARVLGARFGAKFGAFAELGFGYEGILKAGVSLHF